MTESDPEGVPATNAGPEVLVTGTGSGEVPVTSLGGVPGAGSVAVQVAGPGRVPGARSVGVLATDTGPGVQVTGPE